MSEPPTPGGEWRPLADQIAVNVKNFIDGVAALAQGGGDETVPLLLLEVSQILLAGAQLGASSDVIPAGNWEPEVGEDPDLDALRTGLAARLSAVDEYAEVFDPYKDTSALPFRISDDIADVAADLIHGLKHYQSGRSLEALRSEEHTSELQSPVHLVCRLLLEKKKNTNTTHVYINTIYYNTSLVVISLFYH